MKTSMATFGLLQQEYYVTLLSSTSYRGTSSLHGLCPLTSL